MFDSSAQAEEGQDEHDHDDQADDIDDAVHGVAPLGRTWAGSLWASNGAAPE
jgi:hypothetical protein